MVDKMLRSPLTLCILQSPVFTTERTVVLQLQSLTKDHVETHSSVAAAYPRCRIGQSSGVVGVELFSQV